MKVLVIGKPVYNILLPISNFIVEGSKNNINETIEISGGASVYTACMLSKWGIEVFYTGVVGNDPNGIKIKKELESFNVNTKYLEINYEKITAVNYSILNNNNGSSTEITKNDESNMLLKYKYDFVPDYIVFDGSDINGAYAALNNYSQATTIFLANKISEENISISKRCSYVIASMEFISHITKMDFDFKKTKSLVNIFQRVKDLNRAEFIIMLKDKGVLYVENRQVKMIPAIEVIVKDDSNSGNAFFAASVYSIINKFEVDKIAKIANVAGGLSLTKIGVLHTIPELNEVLNLAGFGSPKQEVPEFNEKL